VGKEGTLESFPEGMVLRPVRSGRLGVAPGAFRKIRCGARCVEEDKVLRQVRPE